MRHDRRSERRAFGQDLFAARQVYVRNGPRARYVALSRSLQISVAAAIGLTLLWLALASYAAIAKHLETVEQRRELVLLESAARRLRTTVDDILEQICEIEDALAGADPSSAARRLDRAPADRCRLARGPRGDGAGRATGG